MAADYNWQPCEGNLSRIKQYVDAGTPVFMRKGNGTFNEFHSHCFLKEGRYHRGAGGGSSLDKLSWVGWEYADPDQQYGRVQNQV